jgi:hypothetical protein
MVALLLSPTTLVSLANLLMSKCLHVFLGYRLTLMSEEGIKNDIHKHTPGEADCGSAIEFGKFFTEDFEDTLKQNVQTFKDEKLLEGMDIIGLA